MKSFLRHSQIWLTVVTAYLVVAAPSLCMAGILKHPCECESVEAEDCCSGDREDECSPEGCSHDACENDPCQTRSTSAPDRLGRLDVDSDLELPATSSFVLGRIAVEASFDGCALPRLGYTPLGPPGSSRRIPYHASDIPLLR